MVTKPQIFNGTDLVVMPKSQARQLVQLLARFKPRSREELHELEASGVYEVVDALAEASK